ncbi:NAD(P)/FAD-dependent oxidoreductase [Phenylobacterium sp.]|uniref:FAD-dependent oxidoreductase n=1 Tax=Phenylobacterium sp. TaxID=1871053 RepID=UPI0027345B8D|nr:FAD-dependent monooxygenase [Phenylobacterium sp.]MDP3658685.1 FAD-dependent monooxygenase [Phenylobacterium sp.]
MDDVLIVGGGPVGLIAAIGLARHGLSVRVIEAEQGVMPSPRAMTYHRQALDGLMLLDLFDDATKAGFLSNTNCSRFYKTGEAYVSKSQYPEGLDHPYTLTLAINELTEVALAHMDRYPQTTCTWGSRFMGLKQFDDYVEVEAESQEGPETIRAKWVIGADGGRSGVRKAIGQELIGYTWPDRFVATNMRFDFEGHGWHPMSNLMIDNHYGAIIVRLTRDGQWRVTFHEDAELPVAGVRERIFEYYRRVLPNEGEGAQLDLFSPYSMHQRCVEKMRVGRVLLAGDSAHVTNPTSGFGLTGGMFDSFALIDALAAVVKGERGDEVLDAYAEARRKVFLEISSPISCESKRRVFHLTDAELAEERERLKAAQKTGLGWGSGSRGYHSFRLETPSLVTGRSSAEDRLAKLGRGPLVWEPDGVFA